MRKKPDIKQIGNKIKVSGITFVVLSLVLTVALFVGLVFLQSYLSEEIVYKEVLVAKVDIPENMVITKENAEEYICFKQINILDSNGAITSANAIVDKQAKVGFVAGEVIMEKDFKDVEKYIRDFENPIELSLDASNMYSFDGGKLRAGDLINIVMTYKLTEERTHSSKTGGSLLDENSALYQEVIKEKENFENTYNEVTGNTKEVTESEESDVFYDYQPDSYYEKSTGEFSFANGVDYAMKKAYVKAALDANGLEIPATDTTSNAVTLVLIIEEKNELLFCDALANKADIRISKIVEKNDPIYTEEEEEQTEVEVPSNMVNINDEAVEESPSEQESTEDVSSESEEVSVEQASEEAESAEESVEESVEESESTEGEINE